MVIKLAKENITQTFSNITIDTNDMTLTEYKKDVTNVYKILDVLKQWEGIKDVTLTIKRDSEVPTFDEV
jgi:tRNA A58 N-methylase Trm61